MPLTEAVQPQAPTGIIKSQIKTQEDEEEISTSPAVSQFVSIDFGACNFGQKDVRKELSNSCFTRRRKLLEEDSADLAKELQQELQGYEVVTESEKQDENWDKEIKKMLQQEN